MELHERIVYLVAAALFGVGAVVAYKFTGLGLFGLLFGAMSALALVKSMDVDFNKWFC